MLLHNCGWVRPRTRSNGTSARQTASASAGATCRIPKRHEVQQSGLPPDNQRQT